MHPETSHSVRPKKGLRKPYKPTATPRAAPANNTHGAVPHRRSKARPRKTPSKADTANRVPPEARAQAFTGSFVTLLILPATGQDFRTCANILPMPPRKSISNKRLDSDRRRQDRRRSRRRLRTASVTVNRRSGEDRRLDNRREGVRRASDTLSAKRQIFKRELRVQK